MKGNLVINSGFSLPERYRQAFRFACTQLQADSQLRQTARGAVETGLTGQGSAVLISHGSGGGYDMGLWLARLIGGPYQYTCPSRFGYLRSPVPVDASPEAQADTYIALLDTLAVSSAVIIGLSAGGPSALQFALRHPGRCRGLVMLSAASLPVPPLSPFLKAVVSAMLRSDFLPWLLYTISPYTVYQSNGVNRALIARIQKEPETIRLLDGLYQTSFPSTLRRAGMLNDMRQLTIPFAFSLGQISVPTLVIHAKNDPIVPFSSGEYSARMIPNARFLQMPDGGHFVTITHRDAVVPVVADFLRSCGVPSTTTTPGKLDRGWQFVAGISSGSDDGKIAPY